MTIKNITPFDEAELAIANLEDKATELLDGKTITTQDQSDEISALLVRARTAEKNLEKEFSTEKRPILDAGKALAKKYAPSRDTAKLIQTICKEAITPFLAAQEAIKRKAEAEAIRIANEAQQAAMEAMRASNVSDIAERAKAEKLVNEAKQAAAIASKAGKDKAQSQTGGRAVGIRTTYQPELTDLNAAIKHYWATNRIIFGALVLTQAVVDVRGGSRDIPGFKINEIKTVV